MKNLYNKLEATQEQVDEASLLATIAIRSQSNNTDSLCKSQ